MYSYINIFERKFFMRKKISFMPLLALMAGIAGFFLRNKELSSAIDPVTGLAERWSIFTLSLALLSVIAAAVFVLYGVLTMRGRAVRLSYKGSLSATGLVTFFFAVVGCAAMVIGGIIYFLNARVVRVSLVDSVFALFAVLSGVCQFVLVCGAFKNKSGDSSHIAAVVTPLFLCLWLVITYKNNSTDPELLNYCGMCLALMAAILSFYFSAGFAFGRDNKLCTVIFGLLAVYSCTVAAADFSSLPLRLILVGIIVLSGVNVSCLIGNSTKKQ